MEIMTANNTTQGMNLTHLRQFIIVLKYLYLITLRIQVLGLTVDYLIDK